MIIDIDLSSQEDKNYKIRIDSLPKLSFDRKVAIITNPKVSGLHLKKLLNNLNATEIYIITVADGENYKNMDSVNYVLDRLFDHKFNRKSLLIAFGGGVIGDMTGFIASIFQRGIEFIQIPTTLLSQVDASVGGKTGVNNRYGKNLVGAFWQPTAVYIDTDFLTTLPAREFGAGVAEIVKMAVVFDKKFFKFLEKNSLKDEKNLKYAIARCVELKAKVVRADERENGVRASLNYGHTFCHVVENFTNYSTYLHGEAVAIGINMVNSLAIKMGLLKKRESLRILNLLKRYDLPTEYEIKDAEKFYEAFFLDKKSSDKKIKFIIPKSLGGYEIRDDIDKDLVMAVLKESQW